MFNRSWAQFGVFFSVLDGFKCDTLFLRGLESIRVCDTFFCLVFKWILERFRIVLGSILVYFLCVTFILFSVKY